MGLITVNPTSEQRFVKETSTQEALSKFVIFIPKLETLFQRSVTCDLSYFKSQMIASNVKGQLLNARIIYLVLPHKNNAIERKFIQTFIKAMYHRGDQILVERDSTAKVTAQHTKASIGLDPAVYNISGWDAHGPAAKAEKQSARWTWREKEAHIVSTWTERQKSLKEKTEGGLSRIFNNCVFAVMGPDHADNDNPKKSPRAIDFLPNMDYPWAIVAPRKQLSVLRQG